MLLTNLVTRLSSRKFLLAVGSFVGFISTRHYQEALGIALAYLGIQGVTDHVATLKAVPAAPPVAAAPAPSMPVVTP